MSPLQIQLSLYTYLSAEFIGTASIYNAIRRVGTVLQLMHMLKYYYWVINPADSSGITPEGLGESLLTCVCACVFLSFIMLLKVTKGSESAPAIMWFQEPAIKTSKEGPRNRNNPACLALARQLLGLQPFTCNDSEADTTHQ